MGDVLYSIGKWLGIGGLIIFVAIVFGVFVKLSLNAMKEKDYVPSIAYMLFAIGWLSLTMLMAGVIIQKM